MVAGAAGGCSARLLSAEFRIQGPAALRNLSVREMKGVKPLPCVLILRFK
jgi:hypothetical protein